MTRMRAVPGDPALIPIPSRSRSLRLKPRRQMQRSLDRLTLRGWRLGAAVQPAQPEGRTGLKTYQADQSGHAEQEQSSRPFCLCQPLSRSDHEHAQGGQSHDHGNERHAIKGQHGMQHHRHNLSLRRATELRPQQVEPGWRNLPGHEQEHDQPGRQGQSPDAVQGRAGAGRRLLAVVHRGHQKDPFSIPCPASLRSALPLIASCHSTIRPRF